MLAQALPTGQLWQRFPREENWPKIDPRRVQNRPAGGPKWPPGGSLVPVGPNLAAKAARKPSLGGSGGALRTLLALLEPSWGVPGRSWAPLGGRFGPSRGLTWTIWTMSVALREIQQKPDILQCFWASRACRRGPKTLQNVPGRPLGRLVGPKIGLEGPSGGTQGPS